MGSFTAYRASLNASKEPLKCIGSVNTDIAVAPPFAIALAIMPALTFVLITPADGEVALISVMIGLALLSKIAFLKLIRTLSAGFNVS
jgi:hypothetical protein